MTLYVGDDWAEAHHDVHLMNEAGERIAARRLPEGVEGVAALHELVAEHASEPGDVVLWERYSDLAPLGAVLIL